MTIIESRTLLIARIVVFLGFISGPAFLILSIVNFNQGRGGGFKESAHPLALRRLHED
jgi:hypothetical protein